MKKRIFSALLVLCMVFSLIPATAFATETESTTCEHTYNDGRYVMCEGNYHMTRCDSCDYSDGTFIPCSDDDGDGYCVCGRVISGSDSGEEDPNAAVVTGVSITVDGTTYTSGNVTITAETESIIYTVSGTNFANLSESNKLLYAEGHSVYITDDHFEVNTTTNTATRDMSAYVTRFESCSFLKVRYTNDGEGTWIDTGITLTYDNGIPAAYVMLKDVDADGNEIDDALDATLYCGEEHITWVGDVNAGYSVVRVTAGDYTLSEWDWCPDGYVKPDYDITFTCDEDGNITVTSGNATVEVKDGITYIVVTLEEEESDSGEDDSGEDDGTIVASVMLKDVDADGNEIDVAKGLDAVLYRGEEHIAWVGDATANYGTKGITAGTYTLTDWDYAPEGYIRPDYDITFTCAEDGTITVTSGNAAVEVNNGITYIVVTLQKAKVFVMLKDVDTKGNEIVTGDGLDAKLYCGDEYIDWVGDVNADYSGKGIAAGKYTLTGWDVFPTFYAQPNYDITFTCAEDGTITVTSGNAAVEVKDGITYIVVTLQPDTTSKAYVMLKDVDANGKEIDVALGLDARLYYGTDYFWIGDATADYNARGIVAGTYTLTEWDYFPNGYVKPDYDITFTCAEDGTITVTSKNATVEVKDGISYIVVTLEAADESLVFSGNPGLSFQDYIGMQVMFENSLASDYDKFYVKISQVTPDGVVTTTSAGTSVPGYSSYTLFEQRIVSWSMTEKVTMTLYAEKDGIAYRGESITGSVKDMAMNKLPDYVAEGDTVRCQILVDMLNYGAAVQLAFDYNTDKLANADLGDYAEYGTTTTPEMSDANEISGSGSVKVYRDNISLQDRVEFQFLVKTADLDGMTVKATVGSETADVAYTESGSYTIIRVAVEPAYMRDSYTIGIYDADGNAAAPVYNVSAEAYAKEKLTGDKADVFIAMMRYGDSVALIAE